MSADLSILHVDVELILPPTIPPNLFGSVVANDRSRVVDALCVAVRGQGVANGNVCKANLFGMLSSPALKHKVQTPRGWSISPMSAHLAIFVVDVEGILILTGAA
jgi:hypothetical protein